MQFIIPEFKVCLLFEGIPWQRLIAFAGILHPTFLQS
jgi:hypothetical protein